MGSVNNLFLMLVSHPTTAKIYTFSTSQVPRNSEVSEKCFSEMFLSVHVYYIEGLKFNKV